MLRIARRTPGPDSQYTRVLCLSQRERATIHRAGSHRGVCLQRVKHTRTPDMPLPLDSTLLSPTGRDGREAPVRANPARVIFVLHRVAAMATKISLGRPRR